MRLSPRRAGQRGIPAERAQAGPVQRPVARVVVVGVVERRGLGRGLVALGEEDAEGVVAAVLVLPRHGDAVRGGLVRHAARHAGARAERADHLAVHGLVVLPLDDGRVRQRRDARGGLAALRQLRRGDVLAHPEHVAVAVAVRGRADLAASELGEVRAAAHALAAADDARLAHRRRLVGRRLARGDAGRGGERQPAHHGLGSRSGPRQPLARSEMGTASEFCAALLCQSGGWREREIVGSSGGTLMEPQCVGRWWSGGIVAKTTALVSSPEQRRPPAAVTRHARVARSAMRRERMQHAGASSEQGRSP